jgi:hypothetical protein
MFPSYRNWCQLQGTETMEQLLTFAAVLKLKKWDKIFSFFLFLDFGMLSQALK